MYISLIAAIVGFIMPPHDLEFDEDRGGARNSANLLSLPKDGAFFKATAQALPWAPAGAHAQDRMVVASVFVEALFALAPVPDPEQLKPEKIMVKCLDVQSYLAPALQLLIDEGLLEQDDEDGNTVPRVFSDPTDLQARADELVGQMQDHQELEVHAAGFE